MNRDARSILVYKWLLYGATIALACLFSAFYDAGTRQLVHGPLGLNLWPVTGLGLGLLLFLGILHTSLDQDYVQSGWFGPTAVLLESVFLGGIVILTGGVHSPFLFALLLLALLTGIERGIGMAMLAVLALAGGLSVFTLTEVENWGRQGLTLGMTLLAQIAALLGAAALGAASAGFFRGQKEATRAELSELDYAQEQSRILAKQNESRARLLYDERRRLNTLIEVAHTLSVVRRPDELLNLIVMSSRDQMNASVALVMLRREDEVLVAKSVGINAGTVKLMRSPMGGGLFGKLVKEGVSFRYSVKEGPEPLQAFLTLEAARGLFQITDPTIGYDGTLKERFKNILAVPLRTPTEKYPFGLLVVANRLTEDRFTPEDEGYLNVLATGAAISLSNAKLLAEVETSYRETIVALAQAIEAKDPYTNEHVLRVASYSEKIARSLKLPEEQVELVYKAAILHDVGKISTPDRILGKEGPLNDEEFETMKAHAARGAEILSKIRSLPKEVLRMVRHHHERWDGKGYPDGLRQDEIPLGSQIISVADCYDAMTSDRVYRKGFSHEDALRRMENGYGTQFSPEVLLAFFALTGYRPQRLKESALLGVGAKRETSVPASEKPRVLELETGKEPQH